MSDTGVIPEDENDTVDTAQDGGLDNSGVDVVQQVLGYGRSKYGISGQGQPQQAGGKQPQAVDDGGPVEDDEDNRYPELNGLKAVGRAIQGAIPEDADPNVDKASNVGNSKLNDMADSAASSVGSSLKGAGKAVMGALAPQGEAEANASTANDGAGDALTALADGAKQVGQQVAGATQTSSDPAIPDGQGGGDPNMGPGAAESAAGSKNLLTYMTADAAHPEVVSRAEAAADPQRQLPESQRKIGAIQVALEQGGQEGAWGVLQAYRQKYELLRQGAAAAADKGDAQHAASLATKAFDNLPDGTDVHFTSTRDGVTATVIQAGRVMATVPMSTPQFREFVGAPQQQFDNALNTTPAVSLQQVAKQQSPGERMANVPDPSKAGAARGAQPAASEDQPLEYKGRNDLEKTALKLFPRINGEVDMLATRRNAWVASQLEKGQQYGSQERQATARGDAMRDVAGIRGTAGLQRESVKQEHGDARNVNTNTTRRDIATSGQENARAIADSRNAAGVQGRVISSLTPVNDKRLKQAQDAAGTVKPTQAPTPQAPTPQAATPQAGAPQAPKQVRSAADYQSLRSGEQYLDPKGVLRTKG